MYCCPDESEGIYPTSSEKCAPHISSYLPNCIWAGDVEYLMSLKPTPVLPHGNLFVLMYLVEGNNPGR